MDTQKGGDEQADTGQDRMHQIQQRSQNMNRNSSGSVTPVRKAVIATDSSIPPTIGRRAFGAAGTLPAPRQQTKHHDWEEARHEHARGAVACVEAVDITVEYRAGRVGELTNLEPAMVFST